jgi:hypothetical protein
MAKGFVNVDAREIWVRDERKATRRSCAGRQLSKGCFLAPATEFTEVVLED